MALLRGGARMRMAPGPLYPPCSTPPKYMRAVMNEAGPISVAGHRELKTRRTITDVRLPFAGYTSYALGWD